jgi:hypothetical protein
MWPMVVYWITAFSAALFGRSFFRLVLGKRKRKSRETLDTSCSLPTLRKRRDLDREGNGMVCDLSNFRAHRESGDGTAEIAAAESF